MHPDDRDCDHDEKVRPLQEKGVPQTELGMKGNGVGEKGDVPLGRVRGGRDHLLFERLINPGHHLFDNPFLDINGFQQPWEPRLENMVHRVRVVEVDKGRVHPPRVQVTQQSRSYRSHALAVSTIVALQRERVQHAE